MIVLDDLIIMILLLVCVLGLAVNTKSQGSFFEFLAAGGCFDPSGRRGTCVSLPECTELLQKLEGSGNGKQVLDKYLCKRKANAQDIMFCCHQPDATHEIPTPFSETASAKWETTSTTQTSNEPPTTGVTEHNVSDTISESVTSVTDSFPSSTTGLAGELVAEANIDIFRPPSPSVSPKTKVKEEIKLNANEIPQTEERGNEEEDSRCGVTKVAFKRGHNQAQVGQWPWIAAIYYGGSGGESHLGCVGVLISRQHVLTSSKCAATEEIDLLHQGIRVKEVRLGDMNLIRDPDCSSDGVCADSPMVVPVSSVTVHPDLVRNSGIYEHDVAILTLSRPIRYTDWVRPVCLPFEAAVLGSDLTRSSRNKQVETAGWGATGPVFYTSDNPILYHKTRTIVPAESCSDWETYAGITVGRHLCTSVPKKGGLDLLCSGGVGLGAPLVGSDSLGRAVLLGSLSAEKRVCPGSKQTVYTDVRPELSWIFSILYS